MTTPEPASAADVHALLADLLENDNWSRNSDELATAILELVRPLIAAAERERIRQLATERDARCPVHVPGDDGGDVGYEPFADLLADPAPAIPAEGTTP